MEDTGRTACWSATVRMGANAILPQGSANVLQDGMENTATPSVVKVSLVPSCIHNTVLYVRTLERNSNNFNQICMARTKITYKLIFFLLGRLVGQEL